MNRIWNWLKQGLNFTIFNLGKNKLLSIILILFLSFTALNVLAPVSLQPKLRSQVIIAENGLPLRKFADEQGVWRYPRQLNEVSADYLDILLSYEDRYFYRHFGVNPFSLARAAWQWVTSGRVISGGSTITMQVARLVRPVDRGVVGKFIQITTALQLEWAFSKTEILTYYINHAPFGGRVEGVEAASLLYFGHSAKKLTYAQAALLAVLPQSPSRYRPDRHQLRAERARNKVLRRLRDFGEISNEDYLYFKLEKVEVPDEPHPMLAPLLSRRLSKHNKQEVVKTTIDYDKQLLASDIVKNYVQSLGDKVSASVLIADNTTQNVLVYIGSADFTDNSRFAHVDMVQANRSPGSTLKPFIYGMALDQGIIHSQSLLLDVPLKFRDYVPENFNDRFSGPVSAQVALVKSLNVPAVQLLEQVSPDVFFAKMRNAGLKLNLPRYARPNLSMALGGVSTNLEGLVQSYMSFSNEGNIRALNYLAQAPESKHQKEMSAGQEFLPALSPEAVWIVGEMLRAKSSNKNINELSRLGYSVKTGTSASHTDVWALAVNASYTLGVWIGRPDNGSMAGHQGSFTAVPLLYQLTGILEQENRFVKKPDNVTSQTICWPLGKPSAHQCFQALEAWTINHTAPATLMTTKEQAGVINQNEIKIRVSLESGQRLSPGCSLRGETVTVSLWPEQLDNWLPREWKNSARIPTIDSRCSQPDTLHQMREIEIVGVKQGQIFQGLKDGSLPQLTLTALNPSGTYYWYVNGKLHKTESKPLNIQLKPDVYQITLLDQLGKVDKVSFIVK